MRAIHLVFAVLGVCPALFGQYKFETIRINPSFDANPIFHTVLNEVLLFSAHDGVHGKQLWRTDGSVTGTWLVKQISPMGWAEIQYPCHFNGKVYFAASSTVNIQRELWVTDGTTSGTHLVKDINPAGGSNPSYLTVAGNKLLFAATDTAHGVELWVSDGTESGTHLLKDINSIGNSNPTFLTPLGDLILFSADGGSGEELWVSDGTPDGTQPFREANQSPLTDFFPGVTQNGSLFFSANDGIHGSELWATTGTLDGTSLVKDIAPGFSSVPRFMVSFNGKVYFSAYGLKGRELWVTDGTSSGTQLIKDINPTGSGNPSFLFEHEGWIYFAAEDDLDNQELWRSDGTESGTQIFKDLGSTGNLSPISFTSAFGKLFFQGGNGGCCRHLWVSDGTAAGTQKIEPSGATRPGPLPVSSMVVLNDRLLFPANFIDDGVQLWSVSDSSFLYSSFLPVDQGVLIYPNPAADYLRIEMEATNLHTEFNFQIVDQNGRIVLSEEFNNHFKSDPILELNISSLPTGIYMLGGGSVNHSVRQHFIIMR